MAFAPCGCFPPACEPRPLTVTRHVPRPLRATTIWLTLPTRPSDSKIRAASVNHEPHHHGAALDVMRAGAEDAVAFHLPPEIVARLFLRREDGIEMGDEGNAPARPPAPG